MRRFGVDGVYDSFFDNLICLIDITTLFDSLDLLLGQLLRFETHIVLAHELWVFFTYVITQARLFGVRPHSARFWTDIWLDYAYIAMRFGSLEGSALLPTKFAGFTYRNVIEGVSILGSVLFNYPYQKVIIL